MFKQRRKEEHECNMVVTTDKDYLDKNLAYSEKFPPMWNGSADSYREYLRILRLWINQSDLTSNKKIAAKMIMRYKGTELTDWIKTLDEASLQIDKTERDEHGSVD